MGVDISYLYICGYSPRLMLVLMTSVSGSAMYAVLPNGPIFSDFGPESDFFEQNGPELVRITPQKSGLGGNK